MKLNKVSILIKKTALEFDKISNIILEKYNLTPSQYKVLKFLYEEKENGVRITDLEKYYSMSHATAIGIVRNLEKKGLVGYKKNISDARSRYIIPTEKAFNQKEELEKIGETLEQRLTKKLTEEERLLLIKLLKKTLEINEDYI